MQRPSSNKDKLSWKIGHNVLAPKNGKMVDAIIKQIFRCGIDCGKPSLNDRIRVLFDEHTTGDFDRYELRSNPIYLQRYKLVPYVTVYLNKFCQQTKEKCWTAAYVNKYVKLANTKWTTKEPCFSIYGETGNYSRWSEHIKICSPLLQLCKNSHIFVFDMRIYKWCYGLIIDVDKLKHSHLDIFTVCYRKNGKIHKQYIHQFSSRIALMNNSINNSSKISDEETRNITNCFIDDLYIRDYTLLLTGFIRETGANCNLFRSKELCLILDKYGYVYGLVMRVESKTWLSPIQNKDQQLKPKYGTIHNGCRSPYEKGSLLRMKRTYYEPITKKALNAGAAEFVPKNSKTTEIKYCNNPYISEFAKKVQKCIKISRQLTRTMCNYTKEKLSDPYYYMLMMITLQFNTMQVVNEKIIFTTNLHEYKQKNVILYAVAKRYTSCGYEWRLENRLYSFAEIKSELRIGETLSPLIIKFQLNEQEKIKSILSNRKIFTQVINNANWCKIKVYNRSNNRDRLEFRPTKKVFQDNFVQFIKANESVDLIPILMMNDNASNIYSINYLYHLQIQKNDSGISIGITFEYDEQTEFKVKISGVHIGREYIINQHELIHGNCDCLKDFEKSDIDFLEIGNADNWRNKAKAREKNIKNLKLRNKQLNRELNKVKEENERLKKLTSLK